jgi:hypothetical protein
MPMAVARTITAQDDAFNLFFASLVLGISPNCCLKFLTALMLTAPKQANCDPLRCHFTLNAPLAQTQTISKETKGQH